MSLNPDRGASRWRPVDKKRRAGGQGTGFVGTNDAGERAFIKLMHPRIRQNRQARARFRREVTAYDTLANHPGIPKLVDHNADSWRGDATLFVALELVGSRTLGQVVREAGAMAPDRALAILLNLTDAVDHCHSQGVLHRDIKPENIVMRDQVDSPVLVDFGLSFSEADADESDLTRINEEIGNRFLRLPEHAVRGDRLAASDITQLAGVLYYLLTAMDPRILVDSEGRMPHQRASVQRAFDELAPGPRLRLMHLFDRAFQFWIDLRIATAAEFRSMLYAVTTDDSDEAPLVDLQAELSRSLASPAAVLAQSHAAAHKLVADHLRDTCTRIATATGLTPMWNERLADYSTPVPVNVVMLGLLVPNSRLEFLDFEVESHGGGDVTVLHRGEVVWRGAVPDSDLEESVSRLLLSHAIAIGRRQEDHA